MTDIIFGNAFPEASWISKISKLLFLNVKLHDPGLANLLI